MRATLKASALIAALAVGAAAVPMPASAAPASVKSDFCRKLYDGMASRPRFKAFALSADGKVCNAFWGETSQAAANRKALAGCIEAKERTCRLISVK